MRIWVISNQKSGTIRPAMGLANALAARLPGECVIKHFCPKSTIWRHLPPWAWLNRAYATKLHSSNFVPHWPEIAISNGGGAVAAAIAVKKAAGAGIFSIHMQPTKATAYLDLVVVPKQDRKVKKHNEWPILGSFEDFSIHPPETPADFMPDLPSPVVAILLGGNNRSYLLDAQTARSLAMKLASAVEARGGSFLLSASRRTPQESFSIFRQTLAHLPGQHYWPADETVANPYRKYVSRADIFAVSCDSVNMLSEACAMQKPVYILPLKRRFLRSDGKFRRLHQQLLQASLARPFELSLDAWNHPGLQESSKLVEKVLSSL